MIAAGNQTHWWRITKQSLPVLVGALIIGILAGQLLMFAQEDLLALPVLLALVPAVNGIGGNVGSILGSRVASGLHIGSLWSNQGKGFRRDVTASLILALVVFAFLGLFSAFIAPYLGIPGSISILRLTAITLLAGSLLITVMILLVILVGILSHRKGWDPDNVVVPVLTTAGDTLGILFLLLAGRWIGV